MTTHEPRPDFQAYTTRKRPDGQKDIWIDIGAGYLHQDQRRPPSPPIDGRIVLRPMPNASPADSKRSQGGA